MAPPQKLDILAFFGLGVGTATVSLNYYTSAAFERPFHFSILTILLTAITISFWASKRPSQIPEYERLYSLAPSAGRPQVPTRRLPLLAKLLNALLRVQVTLPPSPFLLLVTCIVGRTILFWRAIRTVQCAWDGLSAFLPLLIALYDAGAFRTIQLPRNRYDTPNRQPREGTSAVFRCVTIALLWALAAVDTVFLSGRHTGAICPPGLWENLIPIAQSLMLGLDTLIIAHIARVRQDATEHKRRTWRMLGSVFFTSAAILVFLSTFSFFELHFIRWDFKLKGLAIRDLIVDSSAASVALLSAIYLLSSHHATTIGLQVSAIIVFIHIFLKISDGTLIPLWGHSFRALAAGMVVLIAPGFLLYISRNPKGSSPSSNGRSSKLRFGIYAVLLVVLVAAASTQPRTDNSYTIENIITDSKHESDLWISSAGRSMSLEEAVSEYRERYGVPPPPNFDKWYDFATRVKSPIIDDFTQIHKDLLPFWGIPAAEVRARTAHLLQYPSLSMGGLIITQGKVEISPHTHGTHMWMMSGMKSMIEQFAKMLPDMQLAFNLDDECRISVPLTEMERLKTSALRSRDRLKDHKDLLPFSKEQMPSWSMEYLDEDQETIWKKRSRAFMDRSKSVLYYDYISPACPPSSAANTVRWWSKKEECVNCSAPHTTGGFVRDWDLSGDLCHQPDLAYQHGFLYSPSAASISTTLFPVFSQSRMQNFADILHPSPWNYVEKVEFDDSKSIPWSEKLNTLFWRGAGSDGYATHGTWQTFLRARFVNTANNLFRYYSRFTTDSVLDLVNPSSPKSTESTIQSSSSALNLNVSFVGPFSRCDTRDCALENNAFYGTADPEQGKIDFQEHWRHRHLMDMDGAGFSGRFIPFLKSQSLPWRAGLFRTWWEERVHAWRHFIPVDVRLNELGGLVRYFGRAGDQAEEMANAGQEWAKRALRKEDMEVYMFRLLLEWGRIVDDHREEIGLQV